MANVKPGNFASSIILFPATLTQWFGQNDKFEWLNDLSMLLNPGQPLYLLVYAVAIISSVSSILQCNIIHVIQQII